MTLIKLFFAFSIVGLFAFGGGYSALSVMEDLVVQRFHFLNTSDFWKIVGIAQITPGPIALNIATFVGAQKGKILGSISSTLGVIFFPSLFSFILIYILKKNQDNKVIKTIFESLQKMIPSLVALSLFSLFKNFLVDYRYLIILVFSFIFIFTLPKFSLILKIIISGIISTFLYYFIKF